MKINVPISICVKRKAAIGDVIMTTGVVRELKRIYGNNASIVVATDAIEVYKNNPRILGVIPYKKQELLLSMWCTTWMMHMNLILKIIT